MKFTYRPTEKAEKSIEEIKKKTGIVAKSKVIEYALNNIMKTETELLEAEATISDLDSKVSKIKVVINNKAQSDKNYKEVVSDLLGTAPGP